MNNNIDLYAILYWKRRQDNGHTTNFRELGLGTNFAVLSYRRHYNGPIEVVY